MYSSEAPPVVYTNTKDKMLTLFLNNGKTPLPDVEDTNEVQLVTPAPEDVSLQRSADHAALDDHYDDHVSEAIGPPLKHQWLLEPDDPAPTKTPSPESKLHSDGAMVAPVMGQANTTPINKNDTIPDPATLRVVTQEDTSPGNDEGSDNYPHGLNKNLPPDDVPSIQDDDVPMDITKEVAHELESTAYCVEFVAMCSAVEEALSLRHMLRCLGVPVPRHKPTQLYGNNQTII